MTKRTNTIIILAAISGVLGSVIAPTRASGSPPKIIKQPKSRLAERGTHVDFTVVATNAGYSLTYQWQINGTNISGATNKSYCIENVQFTNVATYTVVVTGNGSKQSNPANLSVYTLFCTNSNGGTLVTPIGGYTGANAPCSPSFNKGFCPTNDNGLPALFYGPNASPQWGPFQNTSYSPKLTIDTFSCDNAPADTGIMILINFAPPPGNFNPYCNDDSPNAPACHPTGARLGPMTLSTASGDPAKGAKNSYRLNLLYKNPPAPSSGTVTFNWLYSN